MGESLKLSVCVPVYNVAPFVEKCARSLFGQTYGNMEFVFVDDASPDDSVAIVRRALEDYPARRSQVRILRHETNRGLVAARKTAIRAATGDLVAHCDSDDWLDADLYARMVARLEETGADAVLCPIRRYLHTSGRVIARDCPDRLDCSGPDLMRRMDEIPLVQTMVNKVIRRECEDIDSVEWPETVSIAEDYCCTMQLLPRCRLVTSVNGACYHYRVNANSMTRSGNVRRMVDDLARVHDVLARRVPDACSVPARRQLVRLVLFWGTSFGLLSRREFLRWRRLFAALGGRWDWTDMSLWGQRMMRLAGTSYLLSRLLSPVARRRIDDYL